VEQVRGAVEPVALPRLGAGCHQLGLHAALPGFEGLVVRPHVARVGEPDQRTGHEPAALLDDRAMQTRDDVRLEDDVVVEEQAVGRLDLIEQERALLRKPARRHVPVEDDVVPAGPHDADHREQLWSLQRVVILRLVADDDAEVSNVSPTRQASVTARASRSGARGHKDVDRGHVAGSRRTVRRFESSGARDLTEAVASHDATAEPDSPDRRAVQPATSLNRFPGP
jgi:hypothetical protein